jgi:hypothetical protein
VASYYEHGNEPYGSIKEGELLTERTKSFSRTRLHGVDLVSLWKSKFAEAELLLVS